MSDAIITTLISSAFVLVGTIVSIVVTSNKNRAVTTMEQNHIKESIRKLTERVDEHNNYAIEIPLIKKDINYIKEYIKEWEK